MKQSIDKVTPRKTIALCDLVSPMLGSNSAPKTLVVGCGDGAEAGILARRFGGKTIGIDLADQFQFDVEGARPAELRVMDACQLEFPDNAFDLVYSFHSLEHIQPPERALAEMARVLKPGGCYVIGTPNKARLLGYIGSKRPLKKKILWNLHDLRMRLSGQWSNEAGAHAGFTESELKSLCAKAFHGEPEAISIKYYRNLYGSKKFFHALIKSGAHKFMFPCVYMLGLSNKPTA